MLNASNNLIEFWTVGKEKFNDSVKSLVCFDQMNDKQLINEHIEIQDLLQQIDFSNYIGWNSWWLAKLAEQYPVGVTNHLLKDGHLATANFILSHDRN